MKPIKIRTEQASDISQISELTELAFRDMPYSQGDEAKVVERLRLAKALSLSLVATQAERVVGHIAFSPASLIADDQSWFALGPVSVTPQMQRHGIGTKLILAGLAKIESVGAIGCILTGNPDYYQRFGFKVTPENCPDGEPAEYFMVKQFNGEPVSGQFAFHKAFYG